jgi:hypothetical protein
MRRSAEIEKQQLDVFSKGSAHLSINPATIRHVQTLDLILTDEGSMTMRWSLIRKVYP